jgi:methionyl aminopeptidase
LEEKEIADYLKAGTIWRKAVSFARKRAQENVSLLELAEGIEELTIDEGGEVCFPVNLSRNEEAAHFTPKYLDTTLLSLEDVLKIDIGVMVNGRICDGAFTINLNNSHAKQIEANELALENAINSIKEGSVLASKGIELGKIGGAIESTLKAKGFNPVYNLGGHGLGVYNIHAKPSIPNHNNSSSTKIIDGAFAIEPFASNSKGFVSESNVVEIFSNTGVKSVRNIFARKVLAQAAKYKTPFAERWLRKEPSISQEMFPTALRELMKTNCFEAHSGLREEKGVTITQAEKTILLNDGKVIVLGE